jgi:glutathione S-transferase
MKLYYSKGACSLTVRIIINELGLKADFESVDLATKRTETGKDYLTINPKGAVACLEIENKILTENVVILQYLADHANDTQLLPKVGNFSRYRVLEWLNYITTELHKGFAPLFNSALSPEVKEKIFIPAIKAKLGYVNKRLDKEFLLGHDFTLPDAYLFVMLYWAAFYFKFNLAEWPMLNAYFNRLKVRDSVNKSLQDEKLLEIA